MTLLHKTIKVPAKEMTIQSGLRCDLCGKQSPEPENWAERFDVKEVEITYVDGVSYPEGGSSTTLAFDICPDCFGSKLVPWFKSHGVEPRVNEIDF